MSAALRQRAMSKGRLAIVPFHTTQVESRKGW